MEASTKKHLWSCNGWRVVTRQQFSNEFYLHELPWVQGETNALFHTPELSEYLWNSSEELFGSPAQKVQNNIVWTKVGSSDAKLISKMFLDLWGDQLYFV